MVKLNRSKSVPKNMQTTYEVMAGLTDAFCNQHLNAEYRELAQDMAAALCRKRPKPRPLGTAANLGVRHHLPARSDQLPLRPVDAAVHEDG